MNIVKRYTLMIITTLCFYAQQGLAEKLCSLEGKWMIALNTSFTIVKVADQYEFLEKNFLNGCGNLISKILKNNNSITIEQQYEIPGEIWCNNKMVYDLSFRSNDCNAIDGKLTFYFVGKEVDPLTVPLTWLRSPIVIKSPDPKNEVVITAEPRMPEFIVKAELMQPNFNSYSIFKNKFGSNVAPFTWKLEIENKEYSHHRKADLPEYEGDMPEYRPDFNRLVRRATEEDYDPEVDEEDKVIDGSPLPGGVMGGEIKLTVEHYKAVSDTKIFITKGTNPSKTAVESMIMDPLVRLVACYESHYKQFKADQFTGVGFPYTGANNRAVGIMQICKPWAQPEEIWNWRKNVEAALILMDLNRDEALDRHNAEHKKLNKEREKIKLDKCPPGIPTPYTEEQVRIETIHRFNCGVFYKWEPRDAPACKGEWVEYDGCSENDDADHDYINHVLKCKL